MSEALDMYPSFTVKDDATAQWCLEKIREAEADRAKWEAHYAAQMEKVNREVDGTVAFFTARLEEYFDSVPHKASKTMESYTLPGGKLVRKRQQPQYETNDEALVPWLETNMAQLVKVKKSADWAALKKLCSVTPDGQHVVTEDGEIIPGVTVTQRPDIFKAEVEA